MVQFEKVEKGLRCHSDVFNEEPDCEHCEYDNANCGLEVPSDALALIRQQAKKIHELQTKVHELQAVQTARVMTLEEAIEAVSKKGGFVWIEQKSHPLCDAHVSPSNSIFDCPSRKFKDYGKRFIPKKNSFRFMWRCWTSWPTDEQREDTKWDE